MRRLSIHSIALIVLLAGCGPTPAPNLTPQAQTAYQARRVLDVLRVVKDVAVDAEAQNPKLISTADARTIVNWHESLVKAIDAAPNGTKAVVQASLLELQPHVSESTWQKISPYVTLLRSVLEVF